MWTREGQLSHEVMTILLKISYINYIEVIYNISNEESAEQ